MIAAAIRVLRPRTEVATCDGDALVAEIARFEPHLVISNPGPASSGSAAAWVELPLDLAGLARVCIGGHYSERTNPTLEKLLAITDEVAELIYGGEDFEKCQS